MSIDWQLATVPPTGMPYNPSDTSFTNLLYNFLIPLEAPSLNERLYLTPVVNAEGQSDLTIGVGFDLRTGGVPVQDAVFEALGFVPSVVEGGAPSSSDPNYSEEKIEYGYLQQLRADILLGTQAAIDDMNNVMENRYITFETNEAYRTFVNSGAQQGVSQHTQFNFVDDEDVYGVFSVLWQQYYEQKILNIFPSLQGTNFQNSQEEEALADLVWNGGTGLLGPGLQKAINGGNRAQAWFQIRYRSNSSESDVAAERRYYDAQMFGLYNNPSAPTEAEALQAYQMLTTNRAAIINYELEFGTNPYSSGASNPSGEIAGANGAYRLNGTSGQVQTLAQAFDPAAQAERQYLEGLYSGVLPDIEIDDSGGTSSSSFDLRSIDFYAASPSITGQTVVDVDNAPGGTTAEAAANHILLGSEAGDELIGGEGNDILIAQSGDETLQAGAGSDTLIANSGNDTLRLGGNSDVLDFVFPGTSGYTETVIENNGAAVGSIAINGSQLGANLTSTGLDTWTDNNGNTYQFVANPGSPPSGYSPGVSSSDVGELKIVLGGLSGGNEIDIWGFSLSQAEYSSGRFLGISLPPSITLTAGATAGVDPPAPDFTAGSSQSYTVSVDAPAGSAQVITVTLSGASASDFGLVSGTSIVPINSDGTFTVTIPTGQTSASFSLANTGDVGTNASLQLVASVANPSNPQEDTISSSPLTQNYVEPTDDPFNAPTTSTLYYMGLDTTSGGVAYTAYDGALNGSPGSNVPVTSVSGGSNYIYVEGAPSQSIDGGAGNDTIFADFGEKETDGGVNVINGNGGQDAIFIEDDDVPYYWGNGITAPDGPTTVRIYANSETDLSTAIADANTEAATGQQGDVIACGDSGTIVGGNGNDLIVTDNTDVIVAGSGDDTIVTGVDATGAVGAWNHNGNETRDPLDGVNWSTSFENNQLDVAGGSLYLETLPEYDGQAPVAPPSGYEGNFDDAGATFDSANATVFGGGRVRTSFCFQMATTR